MPVQRVVAAVQQRTDPALSSVRRRHPDVDRTVSPYDRVHRADPHWYWAWGQHALLRVQATIGDRPVRRLLDLPCGHGRALRWFRVAYPDAAITAADRDADGVAFCAAQFPGVTAALARDDPSTVELTGEYDVIWVGTLLAHIDQDRWPGFLDLFSRNLAADGTLIFTTHGTCMARILRRGQMLGLSDSDRRRVLTDHTLTGFGYADYPGEEGYGISLSSTDWVAAGIAEIPGLELVEHMERGWGSRRWHHATWACRRR